MWASYIQIRQYISCSVFLTIAVWLLWSWRKSCDEKQNGRGGAVKQQIKTHWDLDSLYIQWLEGNICFGGYNVQPTAAARGFNTHRMHERIKWYLRHFPTKDQWLLGLNSTWWQLCAVFQTCCTIYFITLLLCCSTSPLNYVQRVAPNRVGGGKIVFMLR